MPKTAPRRRGFPIAVTSSGATLLSAPGRLAGITRLKGGYDGRGRRFGVVVSQFNEPITARLLEGALDTLVRHGVRERDIRVAYVPGAFELPGITRELIAAFRPEAVIALAVVIRGQTRHFDQVVAESARGLGEASERTGVPVILGVIPAANVGQALRRAGIKQTNKGRDWALAALETANLRRILRKGRRK